VAGFFDESDEHCEDAFKIEGSWELYRHECEDGIKAAIDRASYGILWSL
jgi:hypothetical protein